MNLFVRAICTSFVMLLLGASIVLASPMTIQATEGNVRALLMGAARMGGLDLVMDDAVGGTVSLSLTAEPEEIIDCIASAKGLVVLKEQGVYLILGQYICQSGSPFPKISRSIYIRQSSSVKESPSNVL